MRCRRCNRLIKLDPIEGWLPQDRSTDRECPIMFPGQCEPE